MSDHLIGLNGYAGAGKDEVARYLQQKGWQWESFAAPLRRGLELINPTIDGVQLSELLDTHGWDKVKRTYPEVRRMLQVIGTEFCRETFGQSCWVEIAEEKLWEGSSDVPYVYSDVRFDQEIEFIREYGGKVVRVERPGFGPVNSHSSERLIENPDYIIVNDGTLEDLHKKVGELLHAIEQ